MKSFCASMAVISLVGASAATAAPQASASLTSPTLVRVDGQLKTPTGDTRTGSVTLVVSLYAEQEDATPLWVEQQAVTLDPAGRYTLFAGATLPDGVPQEFLSGATAGRWLGVAVQGEAEQVRMMLVTVPYAAKAREADRLAGKAASDFVLTEHFSDSVQAALKTRATTSAGVGPEPGVALVDNFLQKTTGGGGGTADSVIFDTGTNIGLGTTGPGGKLDVRGSLTLFGATQGYTFINNDELDFGYSANANYEGNINYSGYNLGGTQFRDLGIFNGKGARIAFFQGSTSRLGIGTTAPVLPLTVVGANPSGALGAYTSNTGKGIAFNPSVTAGTVDIYADYLGGAEPKLHLSTYANRAGAGGLTIDTAGKVGIGTTSPAFLLDVANRMRVRQFGTSVFNSAGMWLYQTTPANDQAFVGMKTDTQVGFYGNSGAGWGMVMDTTSGNVGIGTTDPTSKLHVIDGSNVGIGVFATSSNGYGVYGSTGGGFGVYGTSLSGWGVYGDSSSGPGVYGDSSSGPGVYGNSSSRFGVLGHSVSSYGVYGVSDSSYAGYFVGDVHVTGTVTQGSDGRLKQGVRNLGYGLDAVLQLRPVSWIWKQPSDGRVQLGLIAQEVEAVVPELVTTDHDAEQTKGLNYVGLVPVVIKAIQEQQDTITTLDAENATLKQQNAALDARVTALEQALQRLLGQPPGQPHPSRVSRSDR